MNPLETWLDRGHRKAHTVRFRLARIADSLPPALCKLAKRLVWPSRLKHMRFLPPEITLSPDSTHRWTIAKNHICLAESKTFAELVPTLDKPVSIIATGPSALDYPWDTIRKGERFLIAVNGAPTMLKKLGITADLMVVTDREFALTGHQHFEAAKNVPLVIEFLAAAALASAAPHLLTDRPFTVLERVNMWHGLPALREKALGQLNRESGNPFLLPTVPDPKCRVGWSHRPELGIFSGRTVVFGALQIAIGLGATDVEIIGMDLSGAGRSYDEPPGKRPSQLQEHYQEFILPSFSLMSRALEGMGVSVRNLSPVCPLPHDLFSETDPEIHS